MNLFRTLRFVAVVGLAGTGLSSCLSAPEYPVEPAIDFSSVQMIRNRPAGQTEIDTLVFALNYRDGDGDLGLSDKDITEAPWNATTGGPNNRGYSYNYFIQPYKKVNGAFVKFIAPGGVAGEYDSRFLRLDVNQDGTAIKPGPLKGTLKYKLPLNIDGSSFFPGDVVRFDISIMDRTLHQSNVVTTSEVTLGR